MQRSSRGGGRAAVALALALSVVAAPALAQDAPERAAEHFDRGIAFFNEGRYDAALAEFSRAYELAPAHQTLYNLARVHAALGHAVESAQAYERYLAEAGAEIGARRRREAEAALAAQRARVGRLVVRADVEGARVAVDGVDVATTPLAEPLPVSAGSHTVEVRAPGRESVRRAIAVAGQEEVVLEVSLREEVVPRGTLRVTTTVPEVGVAIDGEPIGVTPLPATVPLRAGEHVVTASRPGYRTQSQRVTIEHGAEAELAFEMRRDPDPPPEHVGRVRIELPNAPYLIRVDGEPMIGLEIDLPIGAHRIELEVTDRQPYEGTLRIPPAGTISIAPPLAWTLEARRRRVEAADTQRTVGVGMSVAAGALLVFGLPVLAWNEAEIARTDTQIIELREDYQTLDGVGCDALGPDPRCVAIEAEADRLAAQQDEQNVLRAISVGASIAGALLGAIGLPLWIAAPSEDGVDAAARATLRLGPGGLALDGRF